jgi:NAD+ diphosphatase
MTAFDSFPLGQPAFITHILDRAAHLRADEAKLLTLEGHRDARAYVVYRDSLVVKQEGGGPRALLSIDEALKFGANPGTIFLGLRDGAAVFGMGISAAAVEKIADPRRRRGDRIAWHGDAGRGAARPAFGHRDGEIDGELASAPWLCANCGTRTAMKEGGWKRECPNCKAEHFPRTDPVVIMLVAAGDKCLLGRRSSFRAGMWSCLAGLSKWPRPSRTRSGAKNLRGIRNSLHRRELLHDAAMALSVI